MSATDTKEMPTPRVDAIVAEFTIPDDAMVSVEDTRKIERDLTAVTAQRDRALGLLERMAGQIRKFHAPDCYCNSCIEFGKLLAEYEALRKGLK